MGYCIRTAEHRYTEWVGVVADPTGGWLPDWDNQQAAEVPAANIKSWDPSLCLNLLVSNVAYRSPAVRPDAGPGGEPEPGRVRGVAAGQGEAEPAAARRLERGSTAMKSNK